MTIELAPAGGALLGKWRWAPVLIHLSVAVFATALPQIEAMDASLGAPLSSPLPLFPSDHWWNQEISQWPVDPASPGYIAFINNGGTRRLHPDLGGAAPTDENPDGSYGMPYVVVSGVTAKDLVSVEFLYGDESDGVDHATGRSVPFYPIPAEAVSQPYWVEGGSPGRVDLRESADRHLLIVDRDRNYLYELYNVFFDSTQSRWFAGSGAFFDMNQSQRRPETWTSADAAGLAILPGLIRYDEVYDPAGAEIRHAFRVTVRATDGFVYPASHRAGSRQGALPMGARLRLKAAVDVNQRVADPALRRLFRAFQKYGLLVADNGSDLYITGTYDPRWDNDVVNPAFRSLAASDFEVIQLGYNPPPATGGKTSVKNLRAALREGTLVLTWDSPGASVLCEVQVTERLNSLDGWRDRAEVSGAAWTAPVPKTSASQFYRVVLKE